LIEQGDEDNIVISFSAERIHIRQTEQKLKQARYRHWRMKWIDDDEHAPVLADSEESELCHNYTNFRLHHDNPSFKYPKTIGKVVKQFSVEKDDICVNHLLSDLQMLMNDHKATELPVSNEAYFMKVLRAVIRKPITHE